MKPDRVEEMIDNKILEHLGTGKTLIDVYYILDDNIDRFSKREDFIDVTKDYMISNWDSINFKKRYTTYYVIASKQRKSDVMWLLMKGQVKLDFELNDLKLFKLLQLKDRLKKNVTI